MCVTIPCAAVGVEFIAPVTLRSATLLICSAFFFVLFEAMHQIGYVLSKCGLIVAQKMRIAIFIFELLLSTLCLYIDVLVKAHIESTWSSTVEVFNQDYA